MKKVTKNIFKACALLLFAAGAAMPMNAAEPVAQAVLTYDGSQLVEVGDTVRIHKDQLKYLTGERMSKWVYNKQHVVRQVGGKRYPQGVLLKGIYSWVYPNSIYPITPKSLTDSITLVACGEYYWDATGITYTTSGEYEFNGKATNGCDSTVVLLLTVNPMSSSSISHVAKDEYYWDVTAQTYTESGDYTFTTKDVNGCDSTKTLHLTVVKHERKIDAVEIRPRKYHTHGRTLLCTISEIQLVYMQRIHMDLI